MRRVSSHRGRAAFGAAAIALAVAGIGSSAADAAVVVNDTFADADRTDPASPTYSEYGTDSDADTNIESSWYGTTTTLSTPAAGTLRGTVGTGSSSWTTYFTPEATPITLANTGDQFTVTWTFTPTTVNSTNVSQGLRVALVNWPESGLARQTADGNPGTAAYGGYALFINMGQTIGHANPFQLLERTDPNTATALLSASGSWTALDDEEATGTTGYVDGTSYTFTFTATRTAAGELDILSTMSGGSLGGDGTHSVAFTDTTPNTFTFDTFSLRPSSAALTAAQFDTSLFRVDTNVPIPEPTSLALVGAGAAALLRRRRGA
jgi:hypothetical protein